MEVDVRTLLDPPPHTPLAAFCRFGSPIMQTKKAYLIWAGYSRKNPNSKRVGGGGVEYMEFPGAEHDKLQGSITIKKELKFSGVQENVMTNFHRSWFSTLELPRGVTQFCRISRGESLFPPEISRGGGGGFRKVYP